MKSNTSMGEREREIYTVNVYRLQYFETRLLFFLIPSHATDAINHFLHSFVQQYYIYKCIVRAVWTVAVTLALEKENRPH